jgi:ParB family chromosome partitioning protein
MRNTVPDEQKAYEALSRLFEQANQNTKQARCVAHLLLAWYDASTFGGWDPVGMWDVDDVTGSDMIAVLELIKESHAYIDELGFDREIQLVWQRWMPVK